MNCSVCVNFSVMFSVYFFHVICNFAHLPIHFHVLIMLYFSFCSQLLMILHIVQLQVFLNLKIHVVYHNNHNNIHHKDSKQATLNYVIEFRYEV